MTLYFSPWRAGQVSGQYAQPRPSSPESRTFWNCCEGMREDVAGQKGVNGLRNSNDEDARPKNGQPEKTDSNTKAEWERRIGDAHIEENEVQSKWTCENLLKARIAREDTRARENIAVRLERRFENTQRIVGSTVGEGGWSIVGVPRGTARRHAS